MGAVHLRARAAGVGTVHFATKTAAPEIKRRTHGGHRNGFIVIATTMFKNQK